MSWQSLDIRSYPVEVSGWDASENFFVEKTTLEWDGEGRKKIALRSSIQPGHVVFVRLAQSLSTRNTFPIAYQAEKVDPSNDPGRFQVSVVQLRPRVASERRRDLLLSGEGTQFS